MLRSIKVNGALFKLMRLVFILQFTTEKEFCTLIRGFNKIVSIYELLR